MAKTSAIFKKINSLRERYYKVSTGQEALVKLISEAEVAEQVYNSNAIENSTLTLEETEKILLQIDLDRFISEREIFEARNLARVVTYIDKRAKARSRAYSKQGPAKGSACQMRPPPAASAAGAPHRHPRAGYSHTPALHSPRLVP